MLLINYDVFMMMMMFFMIMMMIVIVNVNVVVITVTVKNNNTLSFLILYNNYILICYMCYHKNLLLRTICTADRLTEFFTENDNF
jgi:hypothetical protein